MDPSLDEAFQNERDDGDASIGSLAPLVVNAPHALSRERTANTNEVGADGEPTGDDDGSVLTIDDGSIVPGGDEPGAAASATTTMKLDVEDSEAVVVPGHARAVYTGPFCEGVRDSYGAHIAFGRLKESTGSLFVGWVHADMRYVVGCRHE